MRMPGFCTGCRRVRSVRVAPSWRGVGMAAGVCSECEEAAEIRRMPDREVLRRAASWRGAAAQPYRREAERRHLTIPESP